MDSFISGMEESGATVEIVNTDSMTILPCRACTDDVSYETDGECKCEDDMQALYPKLKESDVWVFASPITDSTLSNDIINILDRLEPMFQPVLKLKGTSIRIPKKGKIAFLSSTKDYELTSFANAVNHFKSISKMYEREYAGSVLRPHSWAISNLDSVGLHTEDILNAAKEAGKELINNGKISTEIQHRISGELVPKKSFTNKLNSLLS